MQSLLLYYTTVTVIFSFFASRITIYKTLYIPTVPNTSLQNSQLNYKYRTTAYWEIIAW